MYLFYYIYYLINNNNLTIINYNYCPVFKEHIYKFILFERE